jgi:hypothetical protein
MDFDDSGSRRETFEISGNRSRRTGGYQPVHRSLRSNLIERSVYGG